MGKRRVRYPDEYRARIVELAGSGRSIADLAREFEPSEQTIRNWVVQDEWEREETGRSMSSSERDEVKQLRRKLRRVEQERDILAKATAWFARETDRSGSKKSSGS